MDIAQDDFFGHLPQGCVLNLCIINLLIGSDLCLTS